MSGNDRRIVVRIVDIRIRFGAQAREPRSGDSGQFGLAAVATLSCGGGSVSSPFAGFTSSGRGAYSIAAFFLP